MAQKPETKFQKKVTDALDKLHGTWYFKAQLVARRGIPDLIICCYGNFVAWELKTEDGKATALQLHNLALIDNAQGIARVVTPNNLHVCLKELYDIIEKVHQKTPNDDSRETIHAAASGVGRSKTPGITSGKPLRK